MANERITYLIAHPSAELYGSDRVMLESLEALVRTGARVVVSLPSQGPLVPEIEARGGEAVSCRTLVLRKSMISPAGLIKLAGQAIAGVVAGTRLMSQIHPSAVYVNTLTIPIWAFTARLNGRRVLCHVHEAESSAPALLRLALSLPLMLANRVVANSRFSVEVMRSTSPRAAARADVLYNCVPGPEHPGRPPAHNGLSVVYIGRLSERKGVDVVIDAVARLRADGIDAQLDIVGDVFAGYEWYAQRLRERASKPDLEGAVRFRGFQNSVWPFIAAGDVVVVPSRVDEPFGNTAVEAILAARPVVVSDTSGLREAAAGYASAQYVPPGDVAETTNALRRVHAEKARYLDLAEEDRALAMARHGSGVYRAAIVGMMVGLTEGRR